MILWLASHVMVAWGTPHERLRDFLKIHDNFAIVARNFVLISYYGSQSKHLRSNSNGGKFLLL
jgi:hypothetical protein